MNLTPERIVALKKIKGYTRAGQIHATVELTYDTFRDLIADLEEVVADNRSCQRTAITFAESCNLMDKQFAESVNREKLIRKNLEFERELHAKTTKELAAAQARERHTRDTLNTVLGLPYRDASVLDEVIIDAINDGKRNPWKSAVIEALIVNHIFRVSHESDPVRALADLVDWECKVALDPAVSKEAQELVIESAADAKRYRRIFSEIPHVYTLCVYGAPCIDKVTADALLDQQVVNKEL
jgi:hypothetical protein